MNDAVYDRCSFRNTSPAAEGAICNDAVEAVAATVSFLKNVDCFVLDWIIFKFLNNYNNYI